MEARSYVETFSSGAVALSPTTVLPADAVDGSETAFAVLPAIAVLPAVAGLHAIVVVTADAVLTADAVVAVR